MAWKETVAKSCANRAAVLTEIWAQLAAMGWTLHDDQSGSSYRVYKSNGESAGRLYEYIQVNYATANLIYFYAYLGWNATAHTGSAMCLSTYRGAVTTSETGCTMWMYGDKNLVYVITKVSTTYYSALFGHAPKRFDNTATLVTSDTGSGSSLVINVASIVGFVVGNYYQIIGVDAATGVVGYRYRVQATAIGSGTLTIDSLATSLKGNETMIGYCPSTFFSSSYTAYFCGTCHINLTGSGTSTTYWAWNSLLNPVQGDPDYRASNRYALCPWSVDNISAGYNDCAPWYCDEYILKAAGLVNEDVVGITERDSGIAESGTASTITDTNKAWTIDEHIGRVVVIQTGTGAGQVRKITDNDGTSLTVSPNWTVIPSSDSAYTIVDEAYRYFAASLLMVAREGYA